MGDFRDDGFVPEEDYAADGFEAETTPLTPRTPEQRDPEAASAIAARVRKQDLARAEKNVLSEGNGMGAPAAAVQGMASGSLVDPVPAVEGVKAKMHGKTWDAGQRMASDKRLVYSDKYPLTYAAFNALGNVAGGGLIGRAGRAIRATTGALMGGARGVSHGDVGETLTGMAMGAAGARFPVATNLVGAGMGVAGATDENATEGERLASGAGAALQLGSLPFSRRESRIDTRNREADALGSPSDPKSRIGQAREDLADLVGEKSQTTARQRMSNEALQRSISSDMAQNTIARPIEDTRRELRDARSAEGETRRGETEGMTIARMGEADRRATSDLDAALNLRKPVLEGSQEVRDARLAEGQTRRSEAKASTQTRMGESATRLGADNSMYGLKKRSDEIDSRLLALKQAADLERQTDAHSKPVRDAEAEIARLTEEQNSLDASMRGVIGRMHQEAQTRTSNEINSFVNQGRKPSAAIVDLHRRLFDKHAGLSPEVLREAQAYLDNPDAWEKAWLAKHGAALAADVAAAQKDLAYAKEVAAKPFVRSEADTLKAEGEGVSEKISRAQLDSFLARAQARDRHVQSAGNTTLRRVGAGDDIAKRVIDLNAVKDLLAARNAGERDTRTKATNDRTQAGGATTLRRIAADRQMEDPKGRLDALRDASKDMRMQDRNAAILAKLERLRGPDGKLRGVTQDDINATLAEENAGAARLLERTGFDPEKRGTQTEALKRGGKLGVNQAEAPSWVRHALPFVGGALGAAAGEMVSPGWGAAAGLAAGAGTGKAIASRLVPAQIAQMVRIVPTGDRKGRYEEPAAAAMVYDAVQSALRNNPQLGGRYGQALSLSSLSSVLPSQMQKDPELATAIAEEIARVRAKEAEDPRGAARVKIMRRGAQ